MRETPCSAGWRLSGSELANIRLAADRCLAKKGRSDIKKRNIKWLTPFPFFRRACGLG